MSKELEKYCSDCKEITPHERWDDGITRFEECNRVGCGKMEVIGKLKVIKKNNEQGIIRIEEVLK